MVEINGQVLRMSSTAFRKFRDYAGEGFVTAMRALTYPESSLSLRTRKANGTRHNRTESNMAVTRLAKRRHVTEPV